MPVLIGLPTLENRSGECVYTSLYQRPLLQMYECNVNQHKHIIMELVNLNRDEKWQIFTTFVLYKIYILCFFFFYLKLTLL